MNIIVLKFGGTSVANNVRLNIVANKILDLYEEGYSIIAVVSAQGNKTDTLLSEAYDISDNPNSRELDVLLSTGEQAAISKLSLLISERGYKSISLTGWQAGINTSQNNQNAVIESIDKTRITKELKEGKIVLVAGFQGINNNNDITTLGRGGSDTTAIALAASFGCKCYIYSDVDGVFTTDPKKVSLAKKLPNISYEEMFEMSNEGAKVLHNRCIEIAKKYSIPIYAKCTFTNKDGTIIDNRIESEKVKSIVKNDELTQITVGNKISSKMHIYKLLLVNEIFPIDYTPEEGKIVFTIKSCDFIKVKSILEDKFKDIDIIANRYSKISIIGYGIINSSDIITRIVSCIDTYSDLIDTIDTNNNKIRIRFNDVVSNDILEVLHKNLIE